VCHRTVSGAPGRNDSELASFGNLVGHSAIIHRTVRCASGATTTSRQWSSAEDIKCATVRAYARRSQNRRQKAHRTVYRTCPVHHRTVRWPYKSELQRSNPNGWVMWLAHRTVSGGAPDSPVRPSTEAIPNDHFGGWGYKCPNHPHIQGIQVSAICIQYKSSRLHSKTQTRDQILSQRQSSFQSNSD
jgi:hypothetical protein